jgi:hypothetical protein
MECCYGSKGEVTSIRNSSNKKSKYIYTYIYIERELHFMAEKYKVGNFRCGGRAQHGSDVV